jgi:hypothetical protein
MGIAYSRVDVVATKWLFIRRVRPPLRELDIRVRRPHRATDVAHVAKRILTPGLVVQA